MSHDVLMQYLPYVTLVALLFLLVFCVRQWDKEQRKICAKLNNLCEELNREILEASMLISKNCPDNREAHEALIEAAKHLVYPNISEDGIVESDRVEKRYRKGLEFVVTARKLAGDGSQ